MVRARGQFRSCHAQGARRDGRVEGLLSVISQPRSYDSASLRRSPRFRIQAEALQGDLVKRVTACVLFVLLSLALSGPVSHASSRSAQDAQKQSQRTWKQYSKQQRKEQKKELKAQKKAMKNWKKQHPTKVTVT